MDAVDSDPNDELAPEARDWTSHPDAKLGGWTLEIPLEQLFGLQADEDGEQSEEIRSALSSMLDALRDEGAEP